MLSVAVSQHWTLILEFSDPRLGLISLSSVGQHREKIHSWLKKLLITSTQIYLKLLQGTLVTQQSDKRCSPALKWRAIAAVGVPQGMGPVGTRSYTWMDMMDVDLSH